MKSVVTGRTGVDLVLASGSPRRRELLAHFGVAFRVVAPDIDETPVAGESPVDYVARLACDKARAVDGGIVIAADTTVAIDGDILGKPDGLDHARAMLRRLSGRVHQVHSGVAVRHGASVVHRVVTTEVRFADLDEATIDWYVGTGEPLDKAGAYAVQGAGAVLVADVRGSVSNVVGLPLVELVELLGSVGHRLLS